MVKYYKPGLADSVVDLGEASKLDKITPSDAGTEARLKASGYEIYDPSKKSSLPGLDSSSPVESPGLSAFNTKKQQENDLNKMDSSLPQSTQMLGDIAKRGFEDTPDAQSYQQKIMEAADKIGTTTNEDRLAIEAAARSEFAKFDPMIMKAKTQAKEGRAQNLVTAAKQGGLDSSAWAGLSALVGVEAGGPKGFEGIGGKLAAMGSEYDQTIYDLQVKAEEAAAAARAAKAEAIASGKNADYTKAKELYAQAKQMYDDKTTMMTKKQEVLQSYEEHLKTTSDDAKSSINEEVMTNIGLGIGAEKYSDEEKRAAETSLGIPSGYFDTYYKTQQEAANIKNTDDLVKSQKNVVDLLKDIPENQTIDIAGNTYTGMKEIDTKKGTYSFQETDSSGNVTQVVTGIDPNTGKLGIIGKVSLGRIGKGTSGGGSGSGVGATTYAATLDNLNASKGDDGFVNTQTYAEEYDKFRLKGKSSTFTSNFPPEEFLNPKDPSASKFFKTATQAIKPDKEAPTELQNIQTFSKQVQAFKDGGFTSDEAFDLIFKDGPPKDDEKIIFQNVYGSYWGERPGID